MPKISLADQLDTLKGKISGLFSRQKKTAVAQNNGDAPENAPSQVKRLAPLVLAAAILAGGGYAFQDHILALIAPTPSNDQTFTLPVAHTAPPPTPAAEEIMTKVVSEPVMALVMATEVQEETIELASAPKKESTHDAMNLIERKIKAMQDLQAMNEKSTDTLEMAKNTGVLVATSHDEMLAEPTPNDESSSAQPSINSATSESMQNNQWTLWQASNQWAVQLMAVKTKAYLTDFIRQNELEDGATYFEFTRDGEHFYALVVGVYNTHTEASEAAQTLAVEYKLAPWVRSMQSIQTVIDYDFNAMQPTLTAS
ncbi:MAG: SPOR domain-containing protein [Thiotrichaceae bacterium]|nr:SPOR domain-containing protein [Thiotrichaceae bacterium]